jgi:cholinesterase
MMGMMSAGMGCGPHAVAAARRKAGISAWRYLYAGDWPNTDIGIRGAWHMAEIPIVFGTTEFMSHIPDTAEERKLGEQMRLAWTGFAKNPVSGLSKMGWPVYEDNGEFHELVAIFRQVRVKHRNMYVDFLIAGPVIRLGGENNSEILFDPRSEYDKTC